MRKDNIFFTWAHMELSKYLPQVTHLMTRCDFITQRYWQKGDLQEDRKGTGRQEATLEGNRGERKGTGRQEATLEVTALN